MLVNGVLSDSISARDRGLLYGDGVFRTFKIQGGRPLLWSCQYRKLQEDCAALGLPCPESQFLINELDTLCEGRPDGVAKIIVTRGEGARGYSLPDPAKATRILSISPLPDYPGHYYTLGVKLRVCDIRLSHQPKLAGVKHLNRLENVLATSEWSDGEIAEGVLLDGSGNVVECTHSNLFIIKNGKITTPDLSLCGVAGVQRGRVLAWAASRNIPCQITRFGLDELLQADEAFVVNSIIGLWPVRELQGRIWSDFPVSSQLQKWFLDVAD
jgi:4-amino-4-deoxychorismate lyase